QDDRVQFADETQKLGTGDCDDLVVLYASLLESLGINTAFIEVQDPEKKIAHLYLMFNTDLSPDEAFKISSNEKKYIIRTGDKNQRSVWIPVETTLIEEGFEKAWEMGATSYLQETVLKAGLAEGWVKVLDVE
ncbi:MAG: hypothetical protein KAR38_07385, partial [Calditrichia bacterium]|nr:hypothetical protein [Calditrichia bacterium]